MEYRKSFSVLGLMLLWLGCLAYALDGLTGKELWSSGATITSFTRGGALSGGVGQIYLTTYDGTIYAFGFPMEH